MMSKIAFVLSFICAIYAAPTCDDFATATLVEYGKFIQVPVSTTPALYRVAPGMVFSSIGAAVYPLRAFDSNCTTGSSGVEMYILDCPNPSISEFSHSWVNTNNQTLVMNWTGTISPTTAVPFLQYFYFVQSTAPNMETCNPYMVDITTYGSALPNPTCANFSESTPAVTLPFNVRTSVNVSTSPILLRRPDWFNISAVSVFVDSSKAAAAGCNVNASYLLFAEVECPGDTGMTNSLGWFNNGTATTVETTIPRAASTPTMKWWWIVQGSGSDYVTCNPYPVDFYVLGQYTVTCQNGGVFDPINGVCNCPATYYGETCLVQGECDPASPIMECTFMFNGTNTTGLHACQLTPDYHTVWGACQGVANSTAVITPAASYLPIYIGVGVGAAVAAIAIGVAVYISKKRRTGYESV